MSEVAFQKTPGYATWKKNFLAVWIAEFLAIIGFSTFTPILPLYVESLGVLKTQVNTWSGLVIAAPAFAMAFMSPIWGTLSDHYGRKLMVERALFGGCVIIGLMATAHNVQQLAVLRLLQGALTGSVAAATTLVASMTPRERLGETLGKLQLAVFLGQSLGPLVGGFVADLAGYQMVFISTSLLLLVAGLLVLFMVHETFVPVTSPAQRMPLSARARQTYALLFGSSLLGLVLFLRFSLRLGLRMSSPLLPLLAKSLLPANSPWLSSAAGMLVSLSGLSSALAAPLLGRWADRYGARRILLICAGLAGLGLTMQGLAGAYWQLAIWEMLIGIAIGGTLATISAYVGRVAPEGRTGLAYGLDATAVSLANSLGPSLGGWLADHTSLRMAFLAGGMTAWLSTLGVLRLPADETTRTATPCPTSESA